MSELMDRAVIGMPFDMAMQNHLSRMQFYNRAKAILAERDALLAERDAAFAAGLEAAAEAVLYLCRMKGMGNRTIDGPEAAHLIRALPIKPGP